ncbi:hypothetical protein ACIBF5_02555 [Micromonospora sp. NPDC050417]|uniref:hypothetical protein n=1 Tax=Micromonospora sp. NPDC050417 TaxID=3364280 RepID=UPI003794C740
MERHLVGGVLALFATCLMGVTFTPTTDPRWLLSAALVVGAYAVTPLLVDPLWSAGTEESVPAAGSGPTTGSNG